MSGKLETNRERTRWMRHGAVGALLAVACGLVLEFMNLYGRKL